MKTRLFAILSAVTLLAASAGAESGGVLAGWDFSQYASPGTGQATTLDANYSLYDPNGAGSESAAFGTATFSSALVPTAGEGLNCERRWASPNPGDAVQFRGAEGCATPNVDGPVGSNLTEPFPLGSPSFDAHSILRAEGQTSTNYYAMKATGPVTMDLDVTVPALSGSNRWLLSFGGKMLSGNGPNGGQTSCDPSPGCSSTVSVSFSSGGGFTSAGLVNLTPEDRRYLVDLGEHVTTSGTVRLALDASNGQPVIDNVAVELPETGATVQLLAGAAGLLALCRIRRRS